MKIQKMVGVVSALTMLTQTSLTVASILPGGALSDEQASIVYWPESGELAVDGPVNYSLTSINIDSASGIFTEQPARNLGGSFDNDVDVNIFKATFGGTFDSVSFGNVAVSGLDEAFVLNDLTVVGSLTGGVVLGDVDLVYAPDGYIGGVRGNAFNVSFDSSTNADQLVLDFGSVAMASDFPQLDFDVVNLVGTHGTEPIDLVAIQVTRDMAAFPSDVAAFSNLPSGQTRTFSVSFDTFQTGRYRSQFDLQFVNASDSSQTETLHLELKGRVTNPPVGKVLPDGAGDGTLPVISYNPDTGELFLRSDIPLSGINIESASGIFTGATPTDLLDGVFDNHDQHNVFKATFGDNFVNLSFGPVVQTGLTTEFLLNDLSIIGSWAEGGGLDNVVFSRLVAVPEPSGILMAMFGIGAVAAILGSRAVAPPRIA